MQVGLGPGHIVLDGDPAPLSQRGTAPNFRPAPQQEGGAPFPIFGPFLLCPNGWMYEDATSYAGKPQPRGLCVRWGPSPLPKKGAEPFPIFGPFLLWPNGWMHQDATSYGGRPQPRGLCVRWGLTTLPKKGAKTATFRPMRIVAKWLDGSLRHLASARATLCQIGSHLRPQKGAERTSQFSAHFYCGQAAGCIKMPLRMEVGLGDIVLDGTQPPSPQRGRNPRFSAHVYSGQTAAWINMPLGTEVGSVCATLF